MTVVYRTLTLSRLRTAAADRFNTFFAKLTCTNYNTIYSTMKKLTIIPAVAACILLNACNNSDSQSEQTDTTAVSRQQTPSEPVPMLQGDTKEGFTQLNGKADYKVEDGVLIGTSKYGEPNSFLATDKMYDDFVLEYEVKVDPRMNSGVQIRSHALSQDTTITITNSEGKKQKRELKKGRVYGYQVEIDPSERAYSGGIYDEARRGWLADLSDNEAARNSFKNGEWNQFKVEAKGDTIRTWVNGVPAANLVDTVDAEGFIAFQVHSTDIKEPMQVMWRNIRIQELE